MAIKLNGSTSGSVALDAPADTSPSGTDITLTLPTSAGSSGQYLQTNGSGALAWATISAGKVLKVEHATGGELANITTTSFAATNTTVSITPSAAGSKILVFGAIRVGAYDSDQTYLGTANNSNIAIYRGTTSIKEFGVITGALSTFFTTIPVAYVDTPTYTLGDSITYTIYGKKGEAGDNYLYVDHSNNKSEIIAMEVAA